MSAERLGAPGTDDHGGVEPLFRAVRRRWRIVLLCIVLGAGAAIGLSKRQQGEYTASSTLLFRQSAYSSDPTGETATDLELASLPVIASRTAAVLHMAPSEVESAVNVSGVGQAYVAEVNATDPDPARAALIANTYAQQYVLFAQQTARPQVQTPQATVQAGYAQVVQPAAIPSSPSSPSTKRNAILGTLLGLLLGLGLAFVAERFDRRVRDSSELEEALGEPVLGALPTSPAFARAGTGPLPAAEAEAFGLLRSRLRYFNVDRELRSLLITSANPREGKTTVALNLAIAEAVAGNESVVLVEADLRRPRLAPRLGIESSPGLSEVLSRNATVGAASRRVRVPRGRNGNGATATFTVITAGELPPNPVELIESQAMIDLLSTLAERFDLIILDSPPTSVIPDATPLMRLVSGVIVVSRVGVTSRDSVDQLRLQLSKLKAPTLGVVANGESSKSYHYGDYEADAKPNVGGRSKGSVAPSEGITVTERESVTPRSAREPQS